MPNMKKYYQGASHAVIIGISKYKEEDQLPNAYNDAWDMKKILEKKYEFDDVTSLFDKDATYAKMREIFIDVLQDESRIGPDDRVLVYYSGHGKLRTIITHEGNPIKAGYIIPYDAERGKYSSYLEMETIVDGCRTCQAKHVLLILDCCYSGYAAMRGADLDKPPQATDPYLNQITSNRALQVMAAGEEDEPVNDSGIRPGNSAFTGALLDILESGSDIDGDGILTASEIGSKLGQEVARHVRGIDTQQRPVFNNLSGSGLGDFVFRIFKVSKLESKGFTQAVVIPGRILEDTTLYQNDYIFESLHIYSAHNEIKEGRSTAKIALITAGLPDETHDAIRDLKITKNRISDPSKTLSRLPKYDDTSKIATAICALIASPLLRNKFIGVAPYSELFVYDCGMHSILWKGYGSGWSMMPNDLTLGITEATKKRPNVMLIATASSLFPLLNMAAAVHPFRKAISEAIQSGITVISSAGYPYETSPGVGELIPPYPSFLKNSLVVSSINIDDTKSEFSNYGKPVDVCAYGKDIVSAISDNKYQFLNGPTFPPCIVTGAVALMYTVNPKLKPSEVRHIIYKSSDNIDHKNEKYSGYLGAGRLNVYRALIETKKTIDK